MSRSPGQGRTLTRLVITKSLTDVYGNSTAWTFGPGFLNWLGSNRVDGSTLLATVTAVSALDMSYMLYGMCQVMEAYWASQAVKLAYCRQTHPACNIHWH